MNRITLTTYCNLAVQNVDYDFEECTAGEMVFSVPYDWFKRWVNENGYSNVENFIEEYLYDDSQKVFYNADKEGVAYIHHIDCDYCKKELDSKYSYLHFLEGFINELKKIDIILTGDEQDTVIEILLEHSRHMEIVVVKYGESNVSLECENCMSTLIDSDAILEARQ